MADESPEWLEEYYERINAEKNSILLRKDSFTNWALITLLGFLAIYGQLFLISLPQFINFATLAISLILLFRFYLRSCICYADIRRQNLLRRAIERHWIHGKPSLNRIKHLIRIFDHERWAVDPLGRTLRSQLKAGFLVFFIVPVIALGWELINLHIQFFSLLIGLETLVFSYVVLVFLIIYLVFELFVARRHQPLQQQPRKPEPEE